MIEYDASFLYSSLFLTRRLIKASRVLHLVSPSTKHALDLSRKTEGCIAIARAKWKRMEQCASTLLALSSADRKRCRSGAALPASEVLVSPSSHWRADQSVASSDTTCCPVEAEEIPLARCRSMMVHLTREMSCPSPNSCGYR